VGRQTPQEALDSAGRVTSWERWLWLAVVAALLLAAVGFLWDLGALDYLIAPLRRSAGALGR
jgi:hypothetical protein